MTRSAGDTHVTKTSTEKLQGCYIDQNLTWKTPIKELSSKLKERSGCLSQLKFVQKQDSRKIMANGIFNSVLSYCMPLWGGCDKEDINSLQVLQNRAAQIVTRDYLQEQKEKDVSAN